MYATDRRNFREPVSQLCITKAPCIDEDNVEGLRGSLSCQWANWTKGYI